MNIDLLRDFICLAETLSLTLAAEIRHTTQSNISKRLRRLEESLGKALVDRRSRPMQLTQAGQDFLPKARMILEELDAFRGSEAPWSPSEGGMTIAMPHSATVSIFPRFKERLSHQMSDVFFAPRIANQDTVAQMLARSEIDLALVTRHPRVPPAEELAVFRPVDIARDRLVIVAPPGIPDAEERPLHVSHPLTYIGRIWKTCRGNVPTTREIPHGMAADIRAHCLAGGGRGVLPETLVEADIAAGRLLVYPSKSDLSFVVSLFASPRASRRAKRIWQLAADWDDQKSK
ncbi:hypothetical protein C5748_13060 [Phyllobacterium phragmitis]|uniref:HTH lysR-type domain-containing protein n=1 Tax=Phyllobacterium phragmitis TaxID=2670329 RepID=A0A2S9IRI2_9HYPH|nr:LysR family transcriptional regulator [Phyllobacterium phragmitis]PRD43130.1 hypothetical protein C5748_13060 [Phyllobacterium phragmitis]